MGEHKNLEDKDALAKIVDIAKGEMAMLRTMAEEPDLDIRPMMTQGIDPDGTLWFFSGKSSLKNRQIERDPAVQLVYSIPGRGEFLSIHGTARISQSRAKIDELWTGWARTWFTGGKDDPELSLIAVVPMRGYYWDTKHNRMVQLAKIAIGALTGTTMDDGVMGQLAP
jgi:general stress protein 26